MSQKKSKKIKSTKIQIGDKKLIYGKQVMDMLDSNDLYKNGNFKQLRKNLENDGYIYIRDLISKQIILKARKLILTQTKKDNSILVNKKNQLNDARMCKKYVIF